MWSIPATHPKTVSQSGRATVFMKPHGSQTIVGIPCRRQLLPATSIPAKEHTNRSASLRSTFRWKPRPKITSHAPISGPALKFTHRRMAARVTLFLHAPPPAGASAANKPIHPLHAPRRCQKSPSFSVFLSDHCYCVFLSPESPLFLCFLELYDIFRTLGVVSIDSY